MKKQTIFILIIIMTICVQSNSQNRFYKKHKNAVNDKHNQDIANKNAILEKLNAFIENINSTISNEDKVKLSTPVKEQNIKSVKNTNHFHATGAIPPPIYAYASVNNLNIRSNDSESSKVLSQLLFGEEVEILYQSDTTKTIGEIKAPWLLIKRNNGDEGWTWGGYLSDTKPSKKNKQTKITNWNMIVPASGRISSKFGYRVDPVTKRRTSFHKGIDIAAPKGTPVYAAESGNIHMAKYVSYGYGNLIIIKHSNNLATYYGHLSKILTSKDKKVKKGDLIGKIGTTGRSTGPHLHFEIRKGDKALNPEKYMK